MNAYIFPGQGSQFPGMGKELYNSSAKAAELFEAANKVLGFEINKVMFEGTDEDLRATAVTQPAVFLHSTITALCMDGFNPQMVAGHSLGEFSALAVAGALDFEDALRLVSLRANAMQKACEAVPGTMAAVLSLADDVIEKICADIDGVVVAANYNSPGQLVISGEAEAVSEACAKAIEAGARRALPLKVGGAFHSPLMAPAAETLAKAIEATPFKAPVCPVFQNVDAMPHTAPSEIKDNLLRQLTSPVRWSQSVLNMVSAGATVFTEIGPGKVLTGLVKKTAPAAECFNIG